MAISLKEKEIRRAKDRARQQLCRQKKKASMTEEERARATEKKASMTEEEMTKQRAKATAKKQRYLQKKKASMTEEEMTKQRANDAAKKQLYRKKKKDEENASVQNRDRKNSFDYKIPVDIKGPIQQACKHDQKEIMKVDGNPNTFRVAVCVLCDRLIIGCEAIHKITVESLRSQSQRHRISVKAYEDHHQVTLKDELVSQYEISDLEGLLLSPRAKKTKNKDGYVAFEACYSCYKAWCNSKSDTPPKHAISNGFAIGSIPRDVIANEEITEEMSSLLAPVRPFAYIFAYTAGAHKAIRGHFSFFEVDLTHVGSTMNHFLKTGANPLVYVMLCGRMTPEQKEIVKERARLDIQKMKDLLEWFINKSGHPGYEGVTPPSECPQPNLIADDDTTNNTDQEHDPNVEQTFAGASFHFTSTHEPQDDTGVYDTNQKFVKAMMDRTMPTLLVNGGNYADMRELNLEDVCPMQFPFGQGGPKVKRRTHISAVECYRQYCRLSLPQFFRGDFLLILNHMFNRQRSYETAVVTCKSSLFGQSLAEKMSKLKMKELDQALFQKETRQKVTGTAGEYIRTVEASCKPIGYTALSAKQNRRKHFAMDNYFGGHSIFLTITPCDELSIRVQVFANAGKEVSLPNLVDWEDEKFLKEYRLDFELRKKSRSLYPGACSLVYQHLIQIVTKSLIGWDDKTQTGRPGVFGVPIAFSRTDEEQSRKTLHSHWQIWVKNFNKTRDALFHSDDRTRKAARDALLSYIDQVVCASYGSDFVVTHNCGDSSITMPMQQILQEVEDKNTLRKAQHQDHCLDVKGKVMECKQCGKTFSQSECINMGILHLRQQTLTSIQDNTNSGSEDAPDSSTAIRKEWLDPAVIRYPFDFDVEGRPTEALKQQRIMAEAEGDEADGQISRRWLHDRGLRRDIVHYAFDEHDYTHRGTCFKGGKSECRGHLPEMASEESTIFDNSAIAAMKQDLGVDEHRRHTSDEIGQKAILHHHLNGEVQQKSQYTILPKRTNGSQFINQHSLPISDVLACNTNVTLGDPSHVFYTTLYKSKDTQAEDKMAYHRINASMARRLYRAQQQQNQKEQEERRQQTEDAPAAAESSSDGNDDDSDDEERACFIEGLGRIMTGVNALLSRDVVSSTMAHLLISQGGERFTYSHDFAHILLQNMENVLEEKEGMNFRLRRNWNDDTKETIAWADCSAYDYIHRPEELENLSLYEYTMWYKKEYKSFKQLNDKRNSTTSYKFATGHQGQKFCHLKRRKNPVIPIINMATDLCDIKSLDVLDDSPTDTGTLQHRERYAKTAMMLFYPFRRAEDLVENDTYWQKFVDVGGTKEYDETLDKSLDDTLSSRSQSSSEFWNHGRMVLQNIETRRIAEKDMKRPNRKITYFTETPKSTGKRKREGVDNDDGYDIDLSEFLSNMNVDDRGLQASEPRPLADKDLRSHAKIMKRANVRACSAIKIHTDKNASVLAIAKKPSTPTTSTFSHHNQNNTDANNQEQPTSGNFNVRYEDVLTFIQGSLLVGSNEAGDGDRDMDDGNGGESGSLKQQSLKKIPTMYEIARGDSSKYNLDDKQYTAYQIVCCTFLLQLVTEGDQYDTKLGEMLGATLDPLAESVQRTKDSLVRDLKAKGGKEQLIMFITGPAGCGKSTTMEAAQLYCHRFCNAVAAAFNDKTFFFTATTGSAAALFGGTTIHSAAHLNKSRLNDEMRAVWREDVRILIIDEISFFKASDVVKLDKQLKKLTGRYDMVYGGVSIVFSGDFHQLKPICPDDDVLYSDSDAASVWENTINCAIFLDNSHRFKDDIQFGEILARMRMGQDTREDRELINSRVVNGALTLPDHAPDACFACSTNKERNGVTAATFKMHIEQTHPTIDEERPPPDHTLIIEASISRTIDDENSNNKKRKRRKRRKATAAFHDTVITQLGDDDIKSTEFASKGAKIEPALRTYPGSHHMCITNDDLDEGRGNGTLCKFLAIKLRKDGRERRWKNWDGRKVWTVSVDDVEWVEFEHYPTPTGSKARTFRLEPQEFSATIKFPLTETFATTVGNAKVKQVPVNSNVATTGHKLQGMSKDTLIVNDWNYRCVNWVYVVLSRVRTLAGLYLMKPLDLERSFNVPDSLIRFEQRLKDNKERPILDMLGYHQQQQNNN